MCWNCPWLIFRAAVEGGNESTTTLGQVVAARDDQAAKIQDLTTKVRNCSHPHLLPPSQSNPSNPTGLPFPSASSPPTQLINPIQHTQSNRGLLVPPSPPPSPSNPHIDLPSQPLSSKISLYSVSLCTCHCLDVPDPSPV